QIAPVGLELAQLDVREGVRRGGQRGRRRGVGGLEERLVLSHDVRPAPLRDPRDGGGAERGKGGLGQRLVGARRGGVGVVAEEQLVEVDRGRRDRVRRGR